VKRIAIIILILLCTAGLLAACGPEYVYPGTYIVTFITQTGTDCTVETNGNQIIRMPDDPVRAGYVFNGWFYDDGVWGQEFKNDSLAFVPITENLTVYAKWNYATPESEIIADGLYKGEEANGVIEDIMIALAVPANFVAQATEGSGVQYAVSYATTSQGFRLKLEYEDYTEYYTPNADGYYYIRTDGEGGEYDIVSAEYAASIRDQYLPKACLSVMAEEINTLATVNAPTVSAYFGEGFLQGIENSVRVRGTVTEINLISLAYENDQLYRYTLTASTSATAVGEISMAQTVDSRARYSENPLEYEVSMSYTYGGASISVPTVADMTYLGGNVSEETVQINYATHLSNSVYSDFAAAYSEVTLLMVEFSGRTFSGWYDASSLHCYGGEGSTLNLHNRDITIYALWDEILPAFSLDGGYFDVELYDVYAYDALGTFVPRKTGYKFTGWFMDAGLTDPCADHDTVYTAESVVYAGWTLCNKIDFVIDNGKFMPCAYIAPGDEYILQTLPSPYKEGVTFYGWYTDAALMHPYQGGSLEGVYTLYARYVAA